MFYVAPLFLIALARCGSSAARRGRASSRAVVALAAALLVAPLPFARFIGVQRDCRHARAAAVVEPRRST